MDHRLMHARGLAAIFRATVAMAIGATTCALGFSACSGEDPSTVSPNCDVVSRESYPTSCSDRRHVTMGAGATAEACGLKNGTSGFGQACEAICGAPPAWGKWSCTFLADAGGVSCYTACVVDGRRPPVLDDAPSDRTTLGAWLATMAFHEAASVDAFAILHDELLAHGAPRAILRSIERARRDEIRHARRAGTLARRHGVEPRKPRVRRPMRRDLKTIAVENAREGCGRETLGALVGMHQATHAATAELRRFYATIAADELRHASLSWRMHAWLVAQLPDGDRREVEEALHAAIERMAIDAPTELRAELGLPSQAQLQALAQTVVRLSQ